MIFIKKLTRGIGKIMFKHTFNFFDTPYRFFPKMRFLPPKKLRCTANGVFMRNSLISVEISTKKALDFFIKK